MPKVVQSGARTRSRAVAIQSSVYSGNWSRFSVTPVDITNIVERYVEPPWRLLIIGGREHPYAFSPTGNSWKTELTLNRAFNYLGSRAVLSDDNHVLVTGGISYAHTAQLTVEDLTTHLHMADMNQPRYSHVACRVGRFSSAVVVAGGTKLEGHACRSYIYDDRYRCVSHSHAELWRDDKWIPLDNVPNHWEHSGAAIGDKLFIAGGECNHLQATTQSNPMYISNIDITSGRYTFAGDYDGPRLVEHRLEASTTSTCCALWTIGGYGGSMLERRPIERYDPRENKSQHVGEPIRVLENRSAVIDNDVLVIVTKYSHEMPGRILLFDIRATRYIKTALSNARLPSMVRYTPSVELLVQYL